MSRKESEALFDEHDSASTENSSDSNKPEDLRILEAVLFASDELMTAARIKAILPGQPDARKIRSMVDKINVQLQKERHPFEIVEIGGGYQFRTITFYHTWVRQIFKEKAVKKLSIQALECLAIIAYKQPISKAEIEAIRGVVSDGAMKTLLEKRLVTISGRSDKPGRPLLYATTTVFLTYFGLNKIEDLPRIEEFEALAREKMDDLSIEELAAPDATLDEEASYAEAAARENDESSLFEVAVTTPQEETTPINVTADTICMSSAPSSSDDEVFEAKPIAPSSGELVQKSSSGDATVVDVELPKDEPKPSQDTDKTEFDFEGVIAPAVMVDDDTDGADSFEVAETQKIQAIPESKEDAQKLVAAAGAASVQPEATVAFDLEQVLPKDGNKKTSDAVSQGTFHENDAEATVFDVASPAAESSAEESFEIKIGDKEVARFSEDDADKFGGALMETKAIKPEKLSKKKTKETSQSDDDEILFEPKK